MRVFLVRHAEAAPGDPDELRPLTGAGRAAARALGERLAEERLDEAAAAAGREPLRFSIMLKLEGSVGELEERLRAYEAVGVYRVMLQHLEHEDVERVAELGELATRLR